MKRVSSSKGKLKRAAVCPCNLAHSKETQASLTGKGLEQLTLRISVQGRAIISNRSCQMIGACIRT